MPAPRLLHRSIVGPPMDFFEHQEVARRNTRRLVVLFLVAVLAIIGAVYLAVVLAWSVALAQSSRGGMPSVWDLRVFGLVAGITVLVVGAAALYRTLSLASGGQAVALALGGRLVPSHTTDPGERRLLNVVSEMAIASGTPVPPVYVLDEEPGVNAFAAGHSPSDAVIGVTRGCVQLLSRDELQGVIGHEFSHVLNGDMRLNLRLIGLVYGILAIGLIGMTVLRSLGRSRVRVRSRSRGKGGGGIVFIFLLGAALVVIGYVGVFFANLIKAAVSRQREFLADAASVQFTRNPQGLAGALRKIGGYHRQGLIEAENADEASHMFFSQSFEDWAAGLFATHPPLAERIRRIDPGFDGQFPKVDLAELAPAAQRHAGLDRLGGVSRLTGESAGIRTAASAMVGQPTEAHLQYAAQLIADVPAGLQDAAGEPFGARAVVLAMLLSATPGVRAGQVEALEAAGDPALAQRVVRLLPEVDGMARAGRLVLIDLAIPALAQMSAGQYEQFKAVVARLIRADGRIDLFEWMLQHILLRHLGTRFGDVRPAPVQYYNLRPLADACAVVLAALARVGQSDAAAGQRAYSRAWGALALPPPPMPAAGSSGLEAVAGALDQLNTLSPREKRRLLQASAACVASDKQVADAEAELFRAVADALGCPTPPVLPGQPLV